MSQDPHKPSEDTGLPPRHRISLEKLRSEATEADLWDLDGMDDGRPQDDHFPDNQIEEIPWQDVHEEPQAIPQQEIHPEHDMPDGEYTHEVQYPETDEYTNGEHDHAPELHYTGEEPHFEADNQDDESRATQLSDVFTEEVGEDPAPATTSEPRRLPHDDLGELDDIDDWDDSEIPIPEAHAPEESPPIAAPPPQDIRDSPGITPPVDGELQVPPHQVENKHRKKSFALNEIIAISSLGIGLCLVIGFFLINAFSGLPRITDPRKQPDLPAKGDHFAVTKVRSYWRAPVTSGPDADTVQRGTELIPVIEITANGGSSALRVQFRNSEGAAVGDPITHAVTGETSLVIPSTAGFEDVNIHNAYRTGLIDPWTVEILEASAGTTAGNAFRGIVTVPISPDRR